MCCKCHFFIYSRCLAPLDANRVSVNSWDKGEMSVLDFLLEARPPER